LVFVVVDDFDVLGVVVEDESGVKEVGVRLGHGKEFAVFCVPEVVLDEVENARVEPQVVRGSCDEDVGVIHVPE